MHIYIHTYIHTSVEFVMVETRTMLSSPGCYLHIHKPYITETKSPFVSIRQYILFNLLHMLNPPLVCLNI